VRSSYATCHCRSNVIDVVAEVAEPDGRHLDRHGPRLDLREIDAIVRDKKPRSLQVTRADDALPNVFDPR
jgi:hypothetical protein